jgi:hypothetical protein
MQEKKWILDLLTITVDHVCSTRSLVYMPTEALNLFCRLLSSRYLEAIFNKGLLRAGGVIVQ